MLINIVNILKFNSFEKKNNSMCSVNPPFHNPYLPTDSRRKKNYNPFSQ